MKHISDGQTVAIGGFGAYCSPDELLSALRCSYDQTGHPSNLTIVAGISTGGNVKDDRGMNLLADPGLMHTIIAAHLANPPKVAELVGGHILTPTGAPTVVPESDKRPAYNPADDFENLEE